MGKSLGHPEPQLLHLQNEDKNTDLPMPRVRQCLGSIWVQNRPSACGTMVHAGGRVPKEPCPLQGDKAGLVGRQAAQCRSCQPKGLRAEEPDIRATTEVPTGSQPRLVSCSHPSPPTPRKSPLRASGSEKVARGIESPSRRISAHSPWSCSGP